MRAGKRKKTPNRSPAKSGVKDIPAKYAQQSKLTSRKLKKAAIRKTKNTATRKTSRSATKRATNKRTGAARDEDEVVSTKKYKIKEGERMLLGSTSINTISTTHDDLEALKKEENMVNKVVDKKSNHVKLRLLDVKLKKKEKNRARRIKKRQQNWSNLESNENAPKADDNKKIDPPKKHNTSLQDEGTAAATSIYSSTNKKVKKALTDAKKEKNIFEQKNYAEKLKKKEKNKAKRKTKLHQKQSSIGSNEKVQNDVYKHKIVMPNQGKGTPTETTCIDNDSKTVEKEAKINRKKICGEKIKAVKHKLEEKKLKKNGKILSRREKKLYKNKSRIEALKKLQNDDTDEKVVLAKKLKTDIQIKGIHEKVVYTKDNNSKTPERKDTNCIINTEDGLKDVKKRGKKYKEVGAENIYLDKLMLRKRENRKACRKIQQQKRAAKRFIGMESSHFEKEAHTKIKFGYPTVTKNKRSERAIEKSKKRFRG